MLNSALPSTDPDAPGQNEAARLKEKSFVSVHPAAPFPLGWVIVGG